MQFPGVYLVIIYTVLLHFTTLGTNSWLINVVDADKKAIIYSVQGLVFIFYPLIGLLADIKLTRYRMICFSCWVILIAHVLLSVGSVSFILTNINSIHYTIYTNMYLVTATLAILLAIVGKGMFESTVIQFGTDQMIEASSNQLSSFIHWYYWSLYLGNTCVTIICIGIIEYYSQCNISIETLQKGKNAIHVLVWMILPVVMLQSVSCCIMLLLLYPRKFKNYLNVEPVGANPVKQIIDVLKYAYNHKYPVRRSALSYYLNNYPSRMDFGKIQYGGPFTNEGVEDAKTLLRLVVLLLSFFGFHLSSDGFSTTNHVLQKTCPSSQTLLLLIGNPSIVLNTFTLLGIPILHLFSKRKYFPNMKKRMWFGFLLLLLHELSAFIISKEIKPSSCESLAETYRYMFRSPTANCFYSLIQFANQTELKSTDCVRLCPSSIYTMDSTLMWLLVPQILHGFGYMLVSVSVLEFIFAQAPFRLKGFMIGMWYAMFSITYLFLNIIDFFITYFCKEEKVWVIYESVKIGIIGLSLIIFGISCRWYRYRERDEIVNIQGMIENIFEKELSKQYEEANDEDSDGEDTILISSQTGYHTFD